MATKRIEATIPFTYLIPETTLEEETYYYFNAFFDTTLVDGEYVWKSMHFPLRYYDRPATNAVDVEYDGEYYTNVPVNNHELGERVNGEISFENYPFFIALHESETYGIVYTQTEGRHTLGFPALPSQVVHLSLASAPESTIDVTFLIYWYVGLDDVAGTKNINLLPGETLEAIILKGTGSTIGADNLGKLIGVGRDVTKVSGNIRFENNELLLDEGTEGTITVLGVSA